MAEQRPQRQLSAILAADVAGYIQLVGHDEEGTLARLKELRRTLIDLAIKEHRGRIVKTMGDGLLVQFGSAVDAVRCAIEVQREILIIVAAASNAQAGRREEAWRAITQVRRIDPNLKQSNLEGLFPISRAEDFERWSEGLRKAGLPE